MLLSRLLYYLSSLPTLFLGIENWLTMLKVFLGVPVPKPIVIQLRNGCHFRVRTRMDIWILKETCLDRQYERASVEIENGWNVIDIGAGLGDFAIGVAREHPRCSIYAYEPFPESFALLKENLNLNRAQNVRPFPYAVGGQVGTAQLRFITSEQVQHTTVSDSDRSGSGIEIPSVTLDQIFAELGLEQCHYLKMDCEGAEYEIFFNTGRSTLEKIRHICLEYHDGVTKYSHQDLINFFEKNGFRVRHTPNPVDHRWGLLHASNSR
jgi:FkbM family methyltransferase